MAALERATVVVRSPWGTGSGVLISRTVVLTASHSVPDGIPSMVRSPGGAVASGAVIWRAAAHDLALLSLDSAAPGVPAAIDCRPMAPRQAVLVVSHPLNAHWLVTRGTVGSRFRHRGKPSEHVVLSVAVGPGSSGGPVFDRAGRLRGVIVGASATGGIVVPLFALAVPSSVLCGLPEIARRARTVLPDDQPTGS